MLDLQLVIEALEDRVKFEQVKKPNFPKIADDLTQQAGQQRLIVSHIEDGKTFLGTEYIYRTVEEFRQEIINNYLPWDSETDYKEGDFVCFTDSNNNTFAYIARNDNTNISPEDDTQDNWESDLSFYLRSIRTQSIIQIVNEVITERNVLGDIKEVLEINPLFGQYREREIIPNNYVSTDPEPKSKARGYQIEQQDINHLLTEVTQIGLICDTAQQIPFYLYHSSQIDPIDTFTLDVLVGNENKFIWYDLHDEILLNFNDPRYNSGGHFRILYFDQDLVEGSKIIGFNSLYSVYKNKLHFNSIFPTYIDYPLVDYPNNPPVDTYNVSTDVAFNIQLNTKCNYLYSIERNPAMYDKPLQYKIATTIVNEMLDSSRLSKENNQINKRMNMLLKGSYNEKGTQLHKGLYDRLESYKNQIKIDLSELDPICYKDQKFFKYQY